MVSVITKLIATDPPREEISLGINLNIVPEPPSTAEAPPKSSGVSLLVACALIFVGSALALGLWLTKENATGAVASPQPSAPAALARHVPNPPAAPAPHPQVKEPDPGAEDPLIPPSPQEPEATEGTSAAATPPSTPHPMVVDSSASEPRAERRDGATTVATREPIAHVPPPPPPPVPDPDPTPPPAPVPATPAQSPAHAAKRVRIRTKTGETVVARVHGQTNGRTSVLLPSGELGFTNGTAETDEPFQPATMEQIRQELTEAGPFADYDVLESDHYLVLYQSSTPFAEASIKLLEDLYKNLSQAFAKRNLPIHDPEFPLVAIIFRTESQFRAHQRVDPDVQAYYEILSNRIYFYEKSEHDQHSPEVAALRKPQTVAHEGTHQILQNIGIHPRLAAWPLWLVEGFAEYCSPPTMTRRGAVWGGLGQVNPMHMATIHDLDDPASLYVQGSERQRLGRDRRKPLVEYLVTRSSLTPTDYALSWALTHYLAMKRETEFLAFIRTMSQLPPLEERTPEDHLAAFQAAFGTNLAKLDKTIAVYLSKLKYDPLPYYAVVFEQPIRGNQLRRATIVSQSPSMIRQWLSQISDANGGATSWKAFPHPSKARAQLAAEQWIRSR